MKKTPVVCTVLLVCGLSLAAGHAPPTQGANRQEIIRQARQTYYNLSSQGLTEFQCEVLLDWDAMYKEIKPDPVAQNQLLPILRKVRFQVLVGPTGATTVSHHSPIAPPSEDVAERLRGSTDGMEKVITGFFQTWSLFVINSPFPKIDDDYQIDDTGGKYRLTFNQAAASVVTRMTRDLVIEEMTVTAPDLTGTIDPSWDNGKGGFILNGFETTYKSSKTSPPNVGKLSMHIQYRDVEGLSLPNIVTAMVPFHSGTVDVHLTFTEYHIKKQ